MRGSANTNDTPSTGGTPLPLGFFEKDLKATKLDPPMSDWFCSIPHAMDTISYSIKARQLYHFQYVPWLRLFSFNKICWRHSSGFFAEKLLNKEMLFFVSSKSVRS
jgi:hypothetical protein